ncbi:MAG: AhpC/TSA family protein [Fimbriimonadaceae bacterium]|nr:AhpC/TSA family protein [Fimbriimonadaceae bacterium]
MELTEIHGGESQVLIFLRHYGCIFCREQVSELRDHPELRVTFVALGTQAEAARFREFMKSPHPFVVDSQLALYHRFGFGRARPTQLMNGNVIKRGVRAMFHGHSPASPNADPFVIGGLVVVRGDGTVAQVEPARDAAETYSPASLNGWLDRAGDATESAAASANPASSGR